MRIRIIPMVIVMSFALVVAKVSDIALQMNQTSDEPSNAQAFAQEDDADLTPETEEEAVLSPNYAGGGPSELEITDTTEIEKNLLESLSKRRKELQAWSESISMKENILNATEKKIDRKMAELEKLKKEVSTLLDDYNNIENKKIQRLVKIYENMKPQNAADIFSKMELKILLEVLSKMKEANAAKILAKMDPEKANSITESLAMQRRISTKK